jgi:iron complex outermembrane recepter protein
MKYLSLIILLVMGFAAENLSAQNKISGSVKDENTQESLINAAIYLSDLKIGATTDVNGHYELLNIPNGTYLIEIKYVGYKDKTERLKIDKSTDHDFLLNAAVSELNEVVVTAVTRSTELKQSPLIIKTADKNLLNQNAATNLIDGLKNIAGINQITTGAAISKPIIRGLGYNRVISLYDGIRQEGQQWGDEHGIEIDEFAVDRIEIVKGAGSLMYGSDGIAGVLNFISPKSPPIGEVKTQITSNFQSNNQLIGHSISNAGNKNGLQWRTQFSHKMAGNYQNTNDGKVYNSGFKEWNGSAFLGVNKNWGYSHFNFNSFNSKLGITEGERDSLGNFVFEKNDGNGGIKTVSTSKNDLHGYEIGLPHQLINHLRITSNNYFVLKNGTINLDIGVQNNKRREFSDVLNPSETALFFDLTTLNYNTRFNFNEKNNWETSVGMSGMRQQNLNKGLNFLIPEYHLFDIGAFVSTQKKINPQWLIAGGLRVDNRQISAQKLVLDSLGHPLSMDDKNGLIKFDALKNNYNNVSASLGLTYQINKKGTVKFNFSQGFRAPNIGEISSNGKHEGTFRYEYGNSNLKSEISRQLDIAYFFNSDHVNFEVTPFANFISNYIFSKKLSSIHGGDSIPDFNDPTPAFKFAQNDARLLGGEVYLDIHPHPLDWLHVENAFSFVHATQKNASDSTRYLPFIPAAKYRGELKAQFKTLNKRLSNGYLKLTVDHYFKKNNIFSAYDTETATPAYTLMSVGFGFDIQGFTRKDFINLYFSGENLANISYQNHLSRLKYAPENPATGRVGIYNMGRNFSVKMVLNL